ncbi:cytochrome P450 [Spectribacter hydrogenoxidans]|uniref:Cytochrome P450 n=1 Tax=Spectribacter hydrogenoxidans TaxID=3075608 RepID=A0ABM7YIK7_9GAMM|nr:cytochrome P450 [Salinisphaera sp. W335]MDT0633754.1 cytochrome P450 [Salinisphaera sp. W335]
MPETTFDPDDPAFLTDPLPVYRRLRDEAPVHHLPASGGIWLVTRFEDIRPLVRLPEGRMQVPGVDGGAVFGDGPAGRIYRNLMVLNDPPKHTRLRMLTQKALTPKAVEGLRARVEQVVDETLDAVIERGEMDAVTDLAFVIPYRVICGMLGIPADQRQALMAVTPDFFRVFLPAANDEAGIQACHEACAFFIDYLSEKIEERRADPGDDIFSALVAAEAEGDRLDRDELVATVLSLLAGGFDTTMGMIGAGVYNFAREPEQFERLRADPAGLARAATDEIVRWESPVGVTIRHLPEDFTLGGQRIPAGEPVWLALLSGNHDERQFTNPDRIDIARTEGEHVAFGGSRHFCIGQHLAKLEGEITFRKLAERIEGFELAGPTPRRMNFQFRSFESLPVRFTPARAA